MKIFQIGFSKCGTSSIHERFLQLGLKSVHNDGGHLARTLQKNITAGINPIMGYEGFDAFTDLHHIDKNERIEAYRYFETILTAIPDSKFILNIRPKEKWLKSCMTHPDFIENMRSIYSIDEASIREQLSQSWDRHINAALDKIPNGQLLVFDIEKDYAVKIDEFLELDTGLPKSLERVNATPGASFKAINRFLPNRLIRIFPKPTRNRVANFLKRLP